MNFISKAGMAAMLTITCLNSTAQVKELPDLTKDGLIADYKLAMEILKKQHPNPFKFIDSNCYDRKVDSLLKLAGKQDNVFSMMQYSPVQLIRDVHTNLQLSEDNMREMISQIHFFPFPVLIEKGKLLVNIKGGQIPYGAEITSIDKREASDIIASFNASSYSDGAIETGTDRVYGNFQLMLSLQNPAATHYAIEFRNLEAKR